MKVFLGGTCNNSTWRDRLIPLLQQNNIDFFNPVVEDWTPECQSTEEYEKEFECDHHLYVITKEMKGVFSIAEAVHSAHQKGKYVFFQVLPEGFDESELKSLIAVGDLIKELDGEVVIGDDGFIRLISHLR